MIPLELIEALQARVEAVVFDYRLIGEDGEPRAPVVYAGFAPNKQTAQEADAPCIIIRVVDGNVDKAGYGEIETVTVLIAVYLYQESARDPGEPDTGPVLKNKGWDAVLQILTRLKLSLLKHRMLMNRYELALPLRWEIPQEQPEPYWYGFLELKYQMTVPENEDYEEVINGRVKTQNYDTRLPDHSVESLLRT